MVCVNKRSHSFDIFGASVSFTGLLRRYINAVLLLLLLLLLFTWVANTV